MKTFDLGKGIVRLNSPAHIDFEIVLDPALNGIKNFTKKPKSKKKRIVNKFKKKPQNWTSPFFIVGNKVLVGIEIYNQLRLK
jgi:hypothetical protein